MDNALTTANVPSQFLADVYFVEHVPLFALQVDPRISYILYVPATHYNPDPNSGTSNSAIGKLPLLVYIHGSGRNTVAIYNELVPFANSTPCAILAPVFPAGMNGPNDIDSFKELHSTALRSDLALLSVLDEVAYRWPGLETSRIFMMGFSGGGQFAHRFLYLYPERLAAISVGAPGRPTYLDDSQEWPVGIANASTLFNRTVNTDLVGDVPIQLVVGSNDTELHGDDDFWKWEQEVLGVGGLPPMNETRLESMHRLHDSLTHAGIETELDIVDGIAHDEVGARSTVLKFLQPWIQKGI
ncbi:alpha/beta-hydrolase, partial [Hypoxylon crocopeplum]